MITKPIGLPLVIVATIITSLGVIANNICLDHIMAMQIWMFSNAIFAGFFYGRSRQWWDGSLSDMIMCWMYLMMLGSGIYGLWQAGVI